MLWSRNLQQATQGRRPQWPSQFELYIYTAYIHQYLYLVFLIQFWPTTVFQEYDNQAIVWANVDTSSCYPHTSSYAEMLSWQKELKLSSGL